MAKFKQATKTVQSQKQIQLLLTSQKLQYSLLRIALATTALTSLGILGRATLQLIPSVEPLTSMVVLVGLFFGPIAGFISGASGFYASNFLVWGGQGPWTIFQSLGAGAAGFIGGIFGLLGKSRWQVLLATLIGVTLYELIVTIGMGALVSFSLAYTMFYLVTSLPFSLVHIGSSIGFSLAFYEFKGQIKKLKGGKLLEQEILGLRSINSDSSKSSNRFVPFFYAKRTIGKDSDKSNSKFWFIKRKQNDNHE